MNDDTGMNNVRHISTMPRQRQSKKDVGGVKGRKLSQPNSKTNSESKKSLNLSSPSRYDNNDSRKSLSSNRSGSTSNNIGGNKGRLKMFPNSWYLFE